MRFSALGDGAQLLLEAFASELTSLGIEVPSEQFVASGEVAWDCPSLTVTLGAPSQGQPGIPFGQSYLTTEEATFFATFFVMLLRNVDSVGPITGPLDNPDAESLGYEGWKAFNDAGALVEAAINIKDAQTIVARPIPFAIGQVLPLGPMGGMAGMRLELSIQIDGTIASPELSRG